MRREKGGEMSLSSGGLAGANEAVVKSLSLSVLCRSLDPESSANSSPLTKSERRATSRGTRVSFLGWKRSSREKEKRAIVSWVTVFLKFNFSKNGSFLAFNPLKGGWFVPFRRSEQFWFMYNDVSWSLYFRLHIIRIILYFTYYYCNYCFYRYYYWYCWYCCYCCYCCFVVII